jgi:quinol monooxygenase YgiN
MYVPTRDTKDPLSFVIIEEYDDQAAVGAHIGGEAFKAMMADAETLFVGGAKGLEVGMYTKF